MPPDKPLAAMAGIHKHFGGVEVLRDVRFEVFGGEVHVLAGENGAGKSTLIKILAGVYCDYQGTIEIDGRRVRPRSPIEARALGVAVIHQELSLVPSMSVADNLFLGQPLTNRGLVRDGEHRRQARTLLGQLGIEPDVNRTVEDLPIGARQLVEIAKALRHDAKVIVMDEPTSALSAPEVERLFALIRRLKAQGRAIVYITHKMEEIERIADRITVLRDGQWVGTAPARELPTPKLIQWMIGREVESQFPRHQPQPGAVLLRVEDFSVFDGSQRGRPLVDRVSLSVRSGEILGIGGLQGSGASELLMGLFGGYGRLAQGRAWLDETPLAIRSPRHAIRRGVALLTNDRKATGLVLSMSIVANATMADLARLSPGGWRRPRGEWAAATRLGRAFGLRAASLGMEAGELSGGNQQKVALAKWLQTDPRLLLLDEPTRGVDVGAKHEIYELMNQWTSRGIGIILITSEMPELLAMSDRIVVMHRGRVTSRFSREDATADRVLEAAMGKQMENLAT
jgi:ABC-type sugar transport system ATPase subunit